MGVVVQAVAFGIARRSAGGSWIAGWVLGALLRLVALVVYAFVAARLLGLALVPALLSLTAFFFVTTVVESILLQRGPRQC